MFVAYQWCREYIGYAPGQPEHFPAGYVTAYDYDEPTELDYEDMKCNECIWLIPQPYN